MYVFHRFVHARVASGMSRRCCLHVPRWKATAPYESSTGRKMRALRGRTWSGIRVIPVLFAPCTPDVLTAHFSTGHFPKLFYHKHLRGWLIVYSLERATPRERACSERQPPQVSCHTSRLPTNQWC